MKAMLSALLLLTLFMTGCAGIGSSDQEFEKLAAQYPHETEFAKTYIGYLQAKNFVAIEGRLKTVNTSNREAVVGDVIQNGQNEPAIDADAGGNAAKLAIMANHIPSGQPIDAKLCYYVRNSVTRISASEGNTTYNNTDIAYEYHYQNAWLIIHVGMQDTSKDPGNFLITSMNVKEIPASLEETNKFTFDGKTPGYYLFTLYTIGVFVLMLTAFIICLRTPIPRRKWLWAIFTLVGIGAIQMNWTTGAFRSNPITVQVIGLGFTQATIFQPWIMTATLPIGAIVFFLRRKRWLR